MRWDGIKEESICLSVGLVTSGPMRFGVKSLSMEMSILRLIIIKKKRKYFLGWMVIQVRKRKISKNFILIIRGILLMNCTGIMATKDKKI